MIGEYVLKVEKNIPAAKNIFILELSSEKELPFITCGQFLNLQIPDGRFLLKRPFGVAKSDKNSITLVIAKTGKGTDVLSRVKAGTELAATLPLGNGFTLKEHHKNVMIIAGGVGCAPLLPVLAQYPDRKFKVFLGYPSKDSVVLDKEFAALAETVVCTDDGSCGVQGFPTDSAKLCSDSSGKPDVILACGPHQMLKSVQKLCTMCGIEGYISTEARMGCGIGACLVCTCAVKNGDEEKNVRVCKDGPVFDVKELVL